MDNENSTFAPVIEFSVNDARIAEVGEEFKDIDAYKDLDEAKAAKKTLTKMRTTLGEAHKEAKAEALAYGRRCDAEKNRLLDLIRDIEDPITEQLNEIRDAEKKAEEERVAAIMGHIERIQAFALDRHDMTLEQLNERLDTLLKEPITEERYQELAEDAVNAKEVAESKLRIAIMNEEKRLEEEAEKKRIEEENRELREKLEKQEAEQKEREEKERKEREAQAEEDRKAREKAEAEADALRKEAEERERKEREEREAEEAKQVAALQAPDKVKLNTFADAIGHLISVKPTLQSDAGNQILLDAVASLVSVEEYVKKQSEEL